MIRRFYNSEFDDGNAIYIAKAPGYISNKKNEDDNLRFISKSNLYYPSIEDNVIGIVVKKEFDFYEVDLFCGRKAILNILSFEGATKKSKPVLQKGDLIYCKISNNSSYLPIVLSCQSNSNKKDWSSGEATYGQLKDGVETLIEHETLKSLIKNKEIIEKIKIRVKFDYYLGMNGVIWLKTNNPSNQRKLLFFFMNLRKKESITDNLINNVINDLE